jgi:hypothetical protein
MGKGRRVTSRARSSFPPPEEGEVIVKRRLIAVPVELSGDSEAEVLYALAVSKQVEMVKTAAVQQCEEVHTILSRIRSEYVEMPGMCLTASQAGRLWHLDRDMCEFVLSELVETGFLKRSRSGQFLRIRP